MNVAEGHIAEDGGIGGIQIRRSEMLLVTSRSVRGIDEVDRRKGAWRGRFVRGDLVLHRP